VHPPGVLLLQRLLDVGFDFPFLSWAHSSAFQIELPEPIFCTTGPRATTHSPVTIFRKMHSLETFVAIYLFLFRGSPIRKPLTPLPFFRARPANVVLLHLVSFARFGPCKVPRIIPFSSSSRWESFCSSLSPRFTSPLVLKIKSTRITVARPW